MKKLLSLFLLTVSITACITDGDPESADHGETTQASTAPPEPIHEIIYLDDKPLFASWSNFCKKLEGASRVTTLGCTVVTTRSNCVRGAQDGTCDCDIKITYEGTCH